MTPNDNTPKKAEDAQVQAVRKEFTLSGSEQKPELRDGTANGVPGNQHAARHEEHHHEPLPGLHAQAIQTEADRDENHDQQQASQPEIGHAAVSQSLVLGGTP